MAGRKYTRDKDGKFAPKGGGGAKGAGGGAKSLFGPDPNPTRLGNLTKRIQLSDEIGMERRKVKRQLAQNPTPEAAERLRLLRDVNRTQKKLHPVIRKPKPTT